MKPLTVPVNVAAESGSVTYWRRRVLVRAEPSLVLVIVPIAEEIRERTAARAAAAPLVFVHESFAGVTAAAPVLGR
jgi:hypothetical protein